MTEATAKKTAAGKPAKSSVKTSAPKKSKPTKAKRPVSGRKPGTSASAAPRPASTVPAIVPKPKRPALRVRIKQAWKVLRGRLILEIKD